MAISKGTLIGRVQPGTVVGHWTVIAEGPRRHGLRHLLCRCSCGTEREVYIGSLRTETSMSCGCIGFYTQRTHGMCYTAENQIWRGMIARCHNADARDYKNYGGRGIQVCDRWRSSFADFYADVGPRPSPELTIDRINNDGNYEPGNVRWATRVQQNNNTRWTRERRVIHGRINALKRWHPNSPEIEQLVALLR